MARNRPSRSATIRRDASVIATRRVSDRPSVPLPRVSLPRRPPYVIAGTDRRYYEPPTATRSFYRLVSGAPARVVAPPPRKLPVARPGKPQAHSRINMSRVFQEVPASLVFAQPQKALACIRRSTRRQVLAATGNLGANRYRKPSNPVRC